MSLPPPLPTAAVRRFIAVEGPIGVGKTTVARRLAEILGADLLLEDAEANPFLDRFYAGREGAALPTQLFFLFQRLQQLASLRPDEPTAGGRVADWMLAKDPLFAELTLTPAEFALYQQVYRHAVQAPMAPDLVIYLQAPVPVLLQRIAQRGRRTEQAIRADYLERVAAAYVRHFHDYEASPLLIVNAEEVDFARSDADLAELVGALDRVRAGRHYLNLAAPGV
jgi:deoxyadenosine/deoxycytidine kinase